MSYVSNKSSGGGGGSGTVTSITAGTGLTLTPSPITTTGSVALTIPVVVSSGGTGAITLTGVLIGNGTSAVTGNAVTQYDVLVGGASNAISSVGPGSAGQVLQSAGNAANPAYSTATYPATTTINQLLYSSSNNVVDGVTAGNYGVLISSSSGVPSWLTNGTTGQILTATTSGTPSWAAAGATFTWSVITANQSAVAGNGYICNKASTLVLTLPASGAIGDLIEVTGINTALGWQIAQNANQQIFYGTSSTTLGATGTLTSSAIRDSIKIVCVVAGASTVWNVISSIGNITVV